MTDDETREEAVERKGYPYEVPDILKGPAGRTATSESIERPCGCDDQVRLERAAKACIDIAREMDRTMDYRPCRAIERILREALRER